MREGEREEGSGMSIEECSEDKVEEGMGYGMLGFGILNTGSLIARLRQFE